MKRLLYILFFLFLGGILFAQSPISGGTQYRIPQNNVYVGPLGGQSYLQGFKGYYTDTLFITANKLKLSSGTNGYVLTSDANGNISLQPASGGGGTPAGNNRNIQINANGVFGTPANDSLTLTPVNNGIWSKGGIQTGPNLILDDTHFSNTLYRVDTFTTANPAPNAFNGNLISAYYMYLKDANQRLTQKYNTYSDLHVFSKDSAKISPANSDLYAGVESKLTFEKYPGYSGRSIIQNGSDPAIPADGGSAVFGGVEIFGSTSTSNYFRIRGYTYGHMSYLLGSQFDTLDNYVGYGSSGKGLNNPRVLKWYHFFGGRPSSQIDSMWGWYSYPGTNENNYFDGRMAIGGGHTGPTEKLEVYGNFKLVNGSQGVGKILFSDINGVSSWVDTTGLFGGSYPGDSPDRINGSATEEVSADMAGFNIGIANAPNISFSSTELLSSFVGNGGSYSQFSVDSAGVFMRQSNSDDSKQNSLTISADGLFVNISPLSTFHGGATDSLNYIGTSYVQRDWVLAHAGGGGGTDSPDRINGTATANVLSDMNSKIMSFTNVDTFKVASSAYPKGLFSIYNNRAILGDWKGTTNSTYIQVEDDNKTFTFNINSGNALLKVPTGQMIVIAPGIGATWSVYNSGLDDGITISGQTRTIGTAGGGDINFGRPVNFPSNIRMTGTTSTFRPPVLTATQASALTPGAGDLIYVSSTNGTFTAIGFWGYVSSSWVQL